METVLNREKYSWLLPCAVFLVMLMFTGRDIGGSAISPYLTTALISAVALILPYSQLVAYVSFMLPLSCGIQSAFWVVVAACLLFRGKKVSAPTIIMFIIALLLELFGQIQFEGTDIIIKNIFFYFVSFFLVMYLTMNENKNVDRARNIRYFIYGTAFLFVMIFGRVIMEEGIDEVLAGALRYSMDDKELAEDYVFFTNANNLGLYSSVCFATLLLGAKRLRMPSILYILAILLIVCGGAFSLSRTWLATSVVSLVLFLFFSPKNRVFLSVAIVCGIIALLAFNATMLEPLYEMFEERLIDDDISDAAGRTDLFALYHAFFAENPRYWLTGTGAVYYLQVCNMPNSIHNMFQQIYVCYGLVGLSAFVTYFVRIVKDNKKYIQQYIQYLPFVIYLIFAQTLQFVNPIYCMYPLVLVVYCLQLYKSEYES